MPTIFLGNTDTDGMVASPQGLDRRFRRFSASAARRAIWMMSPGDAIVLPSPANAEYLRYVEQVSQYPEGSLHALAVGGDAGNPFPLNISRLSDATPTAWLQNVGVEGSRWTLEPYIADNIAFEFARQIGVPVSFGGTRAQVVEAADIFNDKRVFRAIAAGLGIPTAPGQTCISPEQLAAAFSNLIPRSGSVIVKVDRHSGADGNVLVSANSADVAPGTCRTYQVSGHSDYVEAARAVHTELG